MLDVVIEALSLEQSQGLATIILLKGVVLARTFPPLWLAKLLGTPYAPVGRWQCVLITILEGPEALIWPELRGFDL